MKGKKQMNIQDNKKNTEVKYIDEQHSIVASSKPILEIEYEEKKEVCQHGYQKNNSDSSDKQFRTSPTPLTSRAIPTAPSSMDDPKEYPISSFAVKRDNMEQVSLNSGNLGLNMIDFSLPGKNGFNLEVVRNYNSSMSNMEEQTPIYTKIGRYTWTISFTIRGYDERLGKNVDIDYKIWDTSYLYSSAVEAKEAADADWEEKKWDFERGEIIEYDNYDTGEVHYATIKTTWGFKTQTTFLGGSEAILSATRPNDYLMSTYGLGLGWGLGFPSIEVVKQQYKLGKNKVQFYNFLHLGDGRAFKLKNNQPEDYNLKDFTFSAQSGSIHNRQYHYLLTFKDGKKAYFYKESEDAIWLTAMTDRFGNMISFNLRSFGGTIVDTLGRTIYLTKTPLSDGYTLTWTLPDGTTIVYTIKNGLLVSVSDQVGRITAYEYTQGSVFKSYSALEYGDSGVNIVFKPLSKINWPTGAKSEYTYEYFDYYSGGILNGTQSMLLLRSGIDYEKDGTARNRRDYWYNTGWKEIKNAYDMHLYVKFASITTGTKVEQYDFDYRKPLNTKTTLVNGIKVREKKITSYFENTLPLHEISTQYQNGNSISSEYTWSYDAKGNVCTETVPISGTTTMSYDGAYNLPLLKSYQKDFSTTIQEIYTLRSDKKAPEWKRIYENSILKEAIYYGYDTNDNMIVERCYANLEEGNLQNGFPNYSIQDRVTKYSYLNTNAKLASEVYNHIFMTEKRMDGILDVTGNYASSSQGYPAGTVAEKYTYDSNGRVIKKQNFAGQTTQYQYDSVGRLCKEILPKNKDSDPEYCKETQYLDTATPSQNQMISINEKGDKTRYEYTSLGKLERITVLAPETILSTNRYDNMNRIILEQVYGSNGVQSATRYTYDMFDRVKVKTVTGLNLSVPYQENYTYHDAFDPSGKYTLEGKTIVGNNQLTPSLLSCVIRDEQGHIVKEIAGNSSGVENVNTSSLILKYDFLGNKISQTDANQNTTIFGYDYAGRVISESHQTEDGTATAYTEYNNLGDKIATVDFCGNRTNYCYDLIGRLTKQFTNLNGSDQMVTRYFYDSIGNIEKQQILCEGTMSSPVWKEIQYTYDSQNRVIDTITNDGITESRCRFSYDPVGNKIAQYTGMIGDSVSGAAKVTYVYDRFGNIIETTDALGNSTSLGRRTEYYNYDDYGVLTGKFDRNWFGTEYQYDALKRVCRETVSDQEGKQPQIYRAYTYGKNGLKLTDKNNHLQVVYGYDTLGRLIKETQTKYDEDFSDIIKQYTYDKCGNRTTFLMSKDNKAIMSVVSVYGKQNRLKEVLKYPLSTNGDIGGIKKMATYTYDNNGNCKTMTYPQNNMSVEYFYNSANLLTDMYNKKNGVHRSSYHYTYYPDGNQKQKISKIAGKEDKITTYQYDKMGRLIEEKEHGSITTVYVYDRFGNRNKMTQTDCNGTVITTDYVYDIRNRLETETKKTDKATEIFRYFYDWNGNQVHREWEKFTFSGLEKSSTVNNLGIYSDKFREDIATLERREYNGFNELISLYSDTLETIYQYRPDGLRCKKSFEDGTSVSHIWDGQNICAEYGENGSIHTQYIRGLNLIARGIGQNLEHYLFNAHGDVVERTSSNGTTLKNYDYDAFGVENNPELLDSNPFRYCGEYYDKESQSIYLRNRSYTPQNGRFTSEDPIQDGFNWYSYCGGNPIAFVDPKGLVAQKNINKDPWLDEAFNLMNYYDTDYKTLQSWGLQKYHQNVDMMNGFVSSNRSVNIPQDGNLGTFMLYMGWNTITNPESEVSKLIEDARSSNRYEIANPEYYGLIDGRITVATLRNIGNKLEVKTGDYVDVEFKNKDGEIIVYQCIIGDAKGPDVEGNIWGHKDGEDIVEIMYHDYTPPEGFNAPRNNPWGLGRIQSITVVGNYYDKK